MYDDCSAEAKSLFQEGALVMRYIKQSFSGEIVELDGNQFEDCTFTDCKLIFSALDRVSFNRCTFTECNWVFDGPAETTLSFLSDLYQGLGPEGRKLVELIVQGIRDREFPQTPASTAA